MIQPNIKLALVIFIALSTYCEVVQGIQCYGDMDCCHRDSYGDCTLCCDIDVGLAVGVIIALALGIPIVIIVAIVVCCCFCPGCPCNRRRHSAPPQQVIVVGQQNPGYYDASGNYVPSPYPGQQQQPGVATASAGQTTTPGNPPYPH